jgi:hypothetical protein
MQIFQTYESLMEHLNSTGKPVAALEYTPDGAPLAVVRCGGDKEPAIFITAGSHSTEHAGVSAAVELIDALETEHRVFIVPTRDPIGLNGYAYALSLGMGEEVELDSFDTVEKVLREGGELLFDEDGIVVALLGEYGYASSRPTADRPHPQWAGYQKMQQLAQERPEILMPLRGRRLYMTPGQSGVEGTGDFGRAYTLIIGLDGDILHLNRFHDTVWAPPEPRAIRHLLAGIKPAISFDIHESQLMGGRFWLSARKQQDADNQQWEERIAAAVIAAQLETGTELAEDNDVLGGVPLEQTWFSRSEKGVYWLDASVRGEGLNLMDFVSRHYGLAFGTEMGMYGSFEQRVRQGMVTVQTAVSVFEERYR